MIWTEERQEEYKTCSGDLWKVFKQICSIDDMEREKHIDMALEVFREVVEKYKDSKVYGYAQLYAQDLLLEVERMLYPGKVVKSMYQDTKRMDYDKFVEYIKNPNPGDLITVTQDGGNLARIKVRTVINA